MDLLLDGLLDDTPQNKDRDKDKDKAAVKFKPKRPSKQQNPSPSIPTFGYSLSPCSTTDQFEGTSNPKTKLQPQRKKQSPPPLSDEPSDINQNEISDHKVDAALSSEVDLSRSDFEIQVNDASECCVQETTRNDEQGQNCESVTEKENEDAPNLDDIFDFSDDADLVFEMDEEDEDATGMDCTGENEDKGRAEKEMKNEGKKSSRREKGGSADADANAEEGSSKKKKLSHRIRRKRRKVDPTLLEMPEDEINPRQISIRNLILLAEAKEKKWNKEATSRNSTDGTSSMPRRREQEEFEFFYFDGDEEQNSRHDSAPEEAFQPTVKKLNYHTYMNRPASSRWTKEETELFYKGIRQFGTDFAMIQQLFPNRTRHQIKLKFKSEDRKHPTHIRDATTQRLTDNSQFEKVMEILEIQADKVSPEEMESSSHAGHGKKEEEIDEEEENFEVSPSDLDNSGRHESAPNDDLDALFDWDNEETGQQEFVF